jgi:RNA polymerase sigma-70 factor (ECF subfamily)
VDETDWARIVAYYDALVTVSPGPIVALNRALALAELRGPEAGREALAPLRSDPKLAEYSFFWAALADIERRAGHDGEARSLYERATRLAKSRAERASYERRLAKLSN